MPITYESYNPMQAIQAGQTLAANQNRLDEQKELSDIRQQAVNTGYDVEKHQKLLMEKGFYEEAHELNEMFNNRTKSKQDLALKGFKVLNKTAQVASQIGAPAWPTLRSALIQSGMSNEESLPIEYNDQAKKITQGLVGNSGKALEVLKMRSGDTATDLLVQGGSIIREGKPYKQKVAGDRDTRSAFEKQVDRYAQILQDKYGISKKDAEFMAADVFIHSKERTDLEAGQKAYEAGLRSSFGDTELADKIRRDVIEMRKEMKSKRLPEPQQPQQQFEEGKIYQDAQGNRARYVNGRWEPVQ